MQNRWGRGLATLVVATVLGVPQFAVARQRCENQGNHNGGNRNAYRDSQAYGYRGNSDYRNYRESGYRDDVYRNNGYSRDRYSNSGYRDSGYYGNGYGDYRPERSPGKSAAIIGGSAAAGAVVGGLSGGMKGAIIGGAVGGVGGLIYDRATKNRQGAW